MKGRIVDLTVSLDGKQRLTVELDGDFRNEFDNLHEYPVSITVKRYRAKRSLDANGYAWVLVDKIAEKMRLPKNDVYRQAIKEIGGVSTVICAQNETVKQIKEMWQDKGIGWQVDQMPSKIKGCTNLVLYFGSSTYDTKQMSALIDQLVQTAEALGIETKSPEEIQSLLEEYDA